MALFRHFKTFLLKRIQTIFLPNDNLKIFKEIYELSALQQCLQSTCMGGVGVGGCAAGLASMDVYSAINAVAWENIGNTKMIFFNKKNKSSILCCKIL